MRICLENRYRTESGEKAALIFSESGTIVFANSLAFHLFDLIQTDDGMIQLPDQIRETNLASFHKKVKELSEGKNAAIHFSTIDHTMESIPGVIFQFTEEKYRFYKVEFQNTAQSDNSTIIKFIKKILLKEGDANYCLQEGIKFILSFFRADLGFIHVVGPSKDALKLISVVGIEKDIIKPIQHLKLDEGITGFIFNERKLRYVDNLASEPLLNQKITAQMLKENDARSYIGLPLLSGDQAIGVLGIVSSKAMSIPNDDDVEQLLIVGQLLGTFVMQNQIGDRERKFFHQLSIFRELSTIYKSPQSFDDLLRKTAQLVVDKLNFWDLAFFQYIPDSKMLKLVAVAGEIKNYLPDEYQQSIEEGIIGWVVRNGKSKYVPDIRKEKNYVHVPGSNILSELAVPIKIGKDIFGVINMESQEIGAFDEIDKWTMETLAQYLALYFVYLDRLMEQSSRANNLEIVNRVTQFLSSSLNINHIQDDFIKYLHNVFENIFYVSFYRYDEKEKCLVKVSSSGGSRSQRPIGSKFFRTDAGILWRIFERKRPLYIADISISKHYKKMSNEKFGSEYILPVYFDDEIYGILNIESKDTDALTPSQVVVLETITNYFSKALRNATLFYEIKQEKEKTDAILSQMNEGVIIVDMDDQIIYTNKSAIGYFPQLGTKNKKQTASFLPKLKENLKENQLQTTFEYSEKENKIWQINAIRMKQTIGSENILIVFDQVTEKKLKEREKIENERIQLAVKMAGSIAHELNQPLTGILGYCSLLLEELEKDSDFAREIRVIEEQASRIASLVKKFQNVVKIKTRPYLKEVEIVDWEKSG